MADKALTPPAGDRQHVPTDQAAPELLDQLRPIRDRLGRHGDLFMRLNGFYRIGPDGPMEPEFGYRDFRNSEFRQPIQEEAASALAALTDLAAPSAPAEVEGLVAAIRRGGSGRLPVKVIEDAATALTALQAENERLRAALTEIANAYTAHGYADAMDGVQNLKSTANEAINAER